MKVLLRKALLLAVLAITALVPAANGFADAAEPDTDAQSVTELKATPVEKAETVTQVTTVDPNAVTAAPTFDKPPEGHRLSAEQALNIGEKRKMVKEERKKFHHSNCRVYMKGTDRWQVSCYSVGGQEITQVIINDQQAKVTEEWRSVQVPWTMARGYSGAFGRVSNALYIWIPLCILFFLPFFDPKRPFRLFHLDLLVLLSFSLSFGFFNMAQLGKSVPLAFLPMVYLILRMLWIARPKAPKPGPLKLLVPTSWLVVALVFLVAFRVSVDLINSNVIDVGYAGVIGADKVAKGEDLYGKFPKDNGRGDTYGPTNYYAYIPFEQIAPWNGKWDDLMSAHYAAIFFDLMTMLLLFLAGRKIRGPTLGVVLAYAWATFPFTLLSLCSNANDALVAMFIAGALWMVASPLGRGIFLGFAATTKLGPLALVPLFATFKARFKGIALFTLAFLATLTLVMLPIIFADQLELFYQRTVEYQAGREAPFSIWGYYRGLHLDWMQKVAQAGAVLFGIAIAFVPRRKSVVQLAALGTALLYLLQMGVTYWFYLYLVWVLPLAFMAIFARFDTDTDAEVVEGEKRKISSVLPKSELLRKLALPILAFVIVWGIGLWVGPTSDITINDFGVFQNYATQLLNGTYPYSTAFPLEYPPLSLIPIWLSSGLGIEHYQATFGILMGLCALGCLLLVGAIVDRRKMTLAGWLFAASPLLVGAIVRTHFDLVPLALMLGSLLALKRERNLLAFILLALGAMTKFFPAILLPVFVFWLWGRGERKDALRGVGLFAGIVLLLSLPFVGQDYLSVLTFHIDRPVQIESTVSSLMLLTDSGTLTGVAENPDAFRSQGIEGGASGVLQAIATGLSFVVLIWLCVAAYRRRDVRSLVGLTFAAVVGFMALGKVFSPQFSIWLLPFFALGIAYRFYVPAALAAIAMVLTQIEFPRHYWELIARKPSIVDLVAARNGLLLVALGVLIWQLRGRTDREDLSSSKDPPALEPA